MGNLMSDEQKAALTEAFQSEGLSCMIIASEIPFITSSPATVKKNAEKIKFLEGHWCYRDDELEVLLNQAFDWKAEKEGREVVFMGGDVHTGFTTDLKCSKT